ncbi:MAG TPA: hypothetical protein VHZ76_02655 [Gammaproteobacteria bacterium]|jgi:hypothetical protein|nr:hypothetical protein [Gammaproteobacteria bacterium]
MAAVTTTNPRDVFELTQVVLDEQQSILDQQQDINIKKSESHKQLQQRLSQLRPKYSKHELTLEEIEPLCEEVIKSIQYAQPISVIASKLQNSPGQQEFFLKLLQDRLPKLVPDVREFAIICSQLTPENQKHLRDMWGEHNFPYASPQLKHAQTYNLLPERRKKVLDQFLDTRSAHVKETIFAAALQVAQSSQSAFDKVMMIPPVRRP